MRLKILAPQLNSAYGTFRSGDVVTNLPDDVAKAWLAAGIGEVPVVSAAKDYPALADKPELDEAIDTDDKQPIVVATAPETKRTARRTGAHPSSHAGPTWGDKKG